MTINVDAATFKNHKFSFKTCVGFVVRDHRGDFIAAGCQCQLIQRFDDPELAEAVAIRRAVSFPSEHNLQQVVMASDCFSVIKKIRSKVYDRSNVGVIVQDVKNLICENPSVTLTYVSRRCNKAAHVLAKQADVFKDVVWFNESPEIIRNIICNERLI